ncbi:MAG TPA: ABC transporter permease [Candidatus Binatia bacterium]|jgi:simple sugar transport system permease protein|nr:ABC transporter permease [Candidatus Binatia bacterium]
MAEIQHDRNARGEGVAGASVQLLLAFLRRREASIIVVALLLFLYFRIVSSQFSSVGNLGTLAQFTAPVAIIACGEVMLLICGEIDLSTGAVFAIAPFILYFTWDYYVPLLLGILIAAALCGVIGLVNGLVTVYLRVPSFVTTLGMLFLLSGITLIISHGAPVQAPAQDTLYADVFGHGTWASISWAGAIVLVMSVVLGLTQFGLHTVATGGNRLGAAQSGILTGRVIIVNFVVASMLAAFAGILEGNRIQSFDPLSGGPNGTTYMFYGVASAVIGGTALAGGSGTIIGGFLGAIVLSILNDGLSLSGVNAYTFNVILGAAILVAMILNVNLGRLRRTGGT